MICTFWSVVPCMMPIHAGSMAARDLGCAPLLLVISVLQHWRSALPLLCSETLQKQYNPPYPNAWRLWPRKRQAHKYSVLLSSHLPSIAVAHRSKSAFYHPHSKSFIHSTRSPAPPRIASQDALLHRLRARHRSHRLRRTGNYQAAPVIYHLRQQLLLRFPSQRRLQPRPQLLLQRRTSR